MTVVAATGAKVVALTVTAVTALAEQGLVAETITLVVRT